MLRDPSKKSTPPQNFSNRQEKIKCIFFSVGSCLKRSERILPIFLPFMGCPGHCVFCAQDKQTGINNQNSLTEILKKAEAAIIGEKIQGSCEIAFYGGTFTAINEESRQLCMDFLRRMKSVQTISYTRCSTRPDRLDLSVLKELREAGIDLIELGIQSFSSEALSLSKRGYTGKTAMEACNIVLEQGFSLGIQLLPGMPGCSPDVFLQDVNKALSFKPACIRFYPCLVPDGTALAQMYRKGSYSPWSTEETISTLGEGLKTAWEAEIPVIRLSVAPEAGFDQILLAGPRHPALGALIQAEALFRTVSKITGQIKAKKFSLALPKRCQGYIWGNKGQLKQRWQEIGFSADNIYYTNNDKGELYSE